MKRPPPVRRKAVEMPVEMQDEGPAMAQDETPEHQLRNLAQAVTGYLELLALRTEDEASAKYIESARTAALEMVAIAERRAKP